MGDLTRLTLDDGSWGSSEARLSPTSPPPRRSTGDAALPSTSTWGGPRPAAAHAADSAATPGASKAAGKSPTPASWTTPSGRAATPSAAVRPSGPTSPSAEFPALPHTAGRGGRSQARRRGGGRGGGAPHPVDGAAAAVPAVDNSALVAEMAAMNRQLEAMRQEIRTLHHENAELRRRLEQAQGVQQHQPYALAPLPRPNFAFTPPRAASDAHARPASTLSPPPPGVPSSPAVDADAKRARRALPLQHSVADTPMGDSPSSSPTLAPSGVAASHDV